MSNAPMPAAANGRAWSSILASGAVKEFGALLLFGLAVAGGGYAVYLIIHLLLTQQAKERDDYRKTLASQQESYASQIAAQRKSHTNQQGALTTLIVEKVIDTLENNEKAIQANAAMITGVLPMLKRTSENAGAIHLLATKILEQQKQVHRQPSETSPQKHQTTPAGRQRPPFEGTGPQ